MSGWACVCGGGVKKGAEDSIRFPSSTPSACAAWEAEGEGHTHLRSFWTPAWWWEWLPGGGEEGEERSEGRYNESMAFFFIYLMLSVKLCLMFKIKKNKKKLVCCLGRCTFNCTFSHLKALYSSMQINLNDVAKQNSWYLRHEFASVAVNANYSNWSWLTFKMFPIEGEKKAEVLKSEMFIRSNLEDQRLWQTCDLRVWLIVSMVDINPSKQHNLQTETF